MTISKITASVTPIEEAEKINEIITETNLKANASDVVNLTGIQNITGDKAFNNKVELQGDTAHILFHIPGIMYTRLQESANGLEVRTGDNVSLAPLFAGGSDANNSVVVTAAKSKAANGYFKLGNGLIIQWGWHSGSGSALTFPTPFTSTNYSVTANYRKQSSSGSGIGHVNFYPTSTTSCYFNSQGGDFQWVAIGY